MANQQSRQPSRQTPIPPPAPYESQYKSNKRVRIDTNTEPSKAELKTKKL